MDTDTDKAKRDHFSFSKLDPDTLRAPHKQSRSDENGATSGRDR